MSDKFKNIIITETKKCKKYKICDYCGLEKLKPDQRAKQITDWAKIVVKKESTKGPFGSTRTHYTGTDMCPICVIKRLTILDYTDLTYEQAEGLYSFLTKSKEEKKNG